MLPSAEALRDAVQALIRAQHTLVLCCDWVDTDRHRGYVGLAAADAHASLTDLARQLPTDMVATLHIPTPGA